MILALLAAVVAQEAPVQASDPAPVPVSAPVSAFASAAKLDEQTLDKSTAREDINQVNQSARSEQDARVSGNSINGPSQTGQLAFSDQAFQNAQGLFVVNTNTGNNVAINASINVNLSFTPGP